jgi:hypothetical protein
MFDLYDEFRRLIAAFDEGKIQYAVCGGLAMAVYNRPRATVDIDVLILSESLELAMGIATKLGYKIRGLDMTFSHGAIEIRRISKIDPVSGHVLSLDMLLVTSAIQKIWNSRVEADWEDGSLSIVSREGLIELKRLRASPQDIADIVALEEDIDEATS